MKQQFKPLNDKINSIKANLNENLDTLTKDMESYNKDQFLQLFLYLEFEEDYLDSAIQKLSELKKDLTYKKIMLGAKANYIMEEKSITLN